MFLQAILCPRAKLIEIPSGLGYANHGYIKMSALHHRLQGRENLLVGQVPGCTEEDQSVGMQVAHELFLSSRPLRRRRAILLPILPSPTMPSCITFLIRKLYPLCVCLLVRAHTDRANFLLL